MHKVKNADYVIMGPEPEFSGPITTTETIHALNWYNYFYTIQSTKKWVEQYLRSNENFSERERASILKSDDLTQTLASLCRMTQRGANLECDLDHKLKMLANTPRTRKHIMVYKIDPILADLDGIIDVYTTSRKKQYPDPTKYKPRELNRGLHISRHISMNSSCMGLTNRSAKHILS